MGVLSRARDWVEEKVDRGIKPYHDWRESRERKVEQRAKDEYREEFRKQSGKYQRGEISEKRYKQRMSRAERTREKTKTPWETRTARGATKAVVHTADVMYNPGGKGFYKDGRPYTPAYAQKIARGRKRTYEGLRSTSTSYNRSVPSAWGLGSGKGQKRKLEKSQWAMVTGKKGKGGGGKGAGWRMLFG